MGLVRRIPEVEAWLNATTGSWVGLADPAYRSLVHDWTASFGSAVRSRVPAERADAALEAVAARLPTDVLLFSGMKIPEIGNLGGRCASAYQVTALARLPVDLFRRCELLVASADLSWTCLFSHETDHLFGEEFYDRQVITGRRPGR